jgi:hypothetical protein
VTALGVVLVGLAGARMAAAGPVGARAASSTPPPRAHVAGTYDGRRVRLFVDGRLARSRVIHGRLDAPHGPIEIGAFLNGATWHGIIDEVALYTRALPAKAIEAHHHAGNEDGRRYAQRILAEPGLASYWRFDERPGRPPRDAAGGAPGTYEGSILLGAPGLIRGDRDRAAALDGASGRLLPPVRGTPDLTRRFTLEAWATVASSGNHHLISQLHGPFLKTDARGRWSVGVYQDERLRDLSAAAAARRDPSTEARTGKGNAMLALLAAVAVVAGGWAGRRPRPARAPVARTGALTD